jgi:ABC-type polysaccharide/polyol phosphate export permease
MWTGDYGFLLSNLIQKDFKIRYRNMSLGVFWSLLNPLVTMGVMTFVFKKIYGDTQPDYPVFVLCGLVPFNFFTQAWGSGTSSLLENARLIKRIAVPREVIPISSVLGSSLHLVIQVVLLLACALLFGKGVNRHWLWLPFVWGMELSFVCGISLMTSAIYIYIRDTRYVVESFNAILFWMVPIFYGSDKVPNQFRWIYDLNPVAALVTALRNILLQDISPAASLLAKLSLSSLFMLALGALVFQRCKRGLYDYL